MDRSRGVLWQALGRRLNEGGRLMPGSFRISIAWLLAVESPAAPAKGQSLMIVTASSTGNTGLLA